METHSILFLYNYFLGHDDDNVVHFVKSAIANIMGLYSQFALRDYTVSQCLGSTSVSLIVAHCQKKLFWIYVQEVFSNFSCRFLNPNYFFPIWIIIWEISSNKLKKHADSKLDLTLTRDFLIDGRRSLIWDVRLGD
jgi:hypothetical protein